MRNMKMKSYFTIAVVLGVFLIGSTIIIKAISAAPVCFDLPDEYFKADNRVTIESKDVCFDFANEHYSIYLIGYIYDEDGNSLGYVNITGGYWRAAPGRYYVYGSTSSNTASDVDGWAYGSGELPGRGEVVDGPNWNSYASAWDAFYTEDPPSGTGKGYASITVNGVKYWISAKGTL